MITSGSVFCGVSSPILTAHERFIPAALLICFAVFFDVMDGRVARSLEAAALSARSSQPRGRDQFRVAPAFLIYNAYVGVESGSGDRSWLFLRALCAFCASRASTSRTCRPARSRVFRYLPAASRWPLSSSPACR
ncbi:MAG: CDP-alcohol phosphatidyltransferase family protein [Cloacibacillus evryensis]